MSYVFGMIQVDDELEIKAYYAGHVLGAAMVQIRVGSESVVYTVSINTALCLQNHKTVPASSCFKGQN